MNNTYFTVHDVVSMVESCKWDRVGICLEPPNDHDFDNVENSGDEDFGSILFIAIIVYFSDCS